MQGSDDFMNENQKAIIDQLYFDFYRFLLMYADSSLKNIHLAEEAVQETFAIACSKPECLCACPNQRGWLVNTLKNVISNIERRRANAAKLIVDCLGDDLDLLPAPEAHEDLSLLYGDIADTKEFQMMLEISQDKKSLIQIAEEKGITVDACKKRAQRAREYLQKRIKR